MSKQDLRKLIDSVKNKKWQDEQSKGVMSSLQQEQTKALQPVLEGMAKVMSDKMTEEFSKAVSSIKVDTPQVNVPEIRVPDIQMPNMPEIKVPEPKVTVNFDASKIKVPSVVMPTEMTVKGDVGLRGVSPDRPVPVQIWDGEGKPVNLLDGLAIRMGGSGGGKTDFFTVKGFGQSAFSEITNPDGRLKVELPTGSSGLTDTELRASSVPVEQVSGSIWSTYITGASGTLAANIVDSSGIAYSGSNPMRHIVVDPTGAELDLMKQGDVFSPGGDHGLLIFGIRSTATGADTYLPLHMHDATEDGESNGNNKVLVESYNDIYDPYSDTWNRLRGNSGYVSPGVLRVVHATDVGLSVNILSATGSMAASIIDSNGVQYSGSNPVPVTTQRALESVGLDVLTVRQVSGASDSVYVTGFGSSVGATILNGEGLARDSWLVSGITATIASANIDSSGVQYSGSNPMPITIISTPSGGATGSLGVSILGSDGLAFGTSKPIPVTMVTGVSASTAVNLHDSGGVGYSGSNPVPVYLVTNFVSSTMTVGAVVSDAVDDGSAPLKTGGIARTANPVAVAGGDTVTFSSDKYGRQLSRPLQARDLINTAYVSVSNGTETTLLAATAGFYNELIWILASNNSTVAVGVDIRAVTAGNILMHLEIPANSTTGIVTPAVPMFGAIADQSGNNWTVDLPDITGTTVYVTALFSKEL